MTENRLNAEAITQWLVAQVAQSCKLPPESVGLQAPFSRLGLDSAEAVQLTAALEDWLGVRLPATLFWDYPNIDDVCRAIVNGEALTVGEETG